MDGTQLRCKPHGPAPIVIFKVLSKLEALHLEVLQKDLHLNEISIRP